MNNNRGFSVIEVLIAATIIVVALLAIASMAPTAYRTVDWSGEDTIAVTLAQRHIEALKNQPYANLIPGGPVTFNYPDPGDYAGYTRETTIADNTPTSWIKQVTVTVASPTGGRQPVTLTTLIAR